jgi:hypothetical protein
VKGPCDNLIFDHRSPTGMIELHGFEEVSEEVSEENRRCQAFRRQSLKTIVQFVSYRTQA